MRKDEHIKYALECGNKDSLSVIKLEYYSMPNLCIGDIDISTYFCETKFNLPIYINAMTGGSEKANNINKRLEYISKKLDIFMFSGSYSPNLDGDNYYYPKKLGINLGADKNLVDFNKAIEETNAKILQIHLNPIQELFMNEGDRDFKSYKLNLKNALENIKIPIIVKETGYGMSKQMIFDLIAMGVKTIDISSNDGTNFTYIEDRRNKLSRPYLYELGYNLRQSLLNSQEYQNKVEILASGGINNSYNVVKCLAMGAKAVGISGYILKLLDEYDDNYIINILKQMIYEIKVLILSTNSKNLKELNGKWYIEYK